MFVVLSSNFELEFYNIKTMGFLHEKNKIKMYTFLLINIRGKNKTAGPYVKI